jgi:hypothetical protein
MVLVAGWFRELGLHDPRPPRSDAPNRPLFGPVVVGPMPLTSSGRTTYGDGRPQDPGEGTMTRTEPTRRPPVATRQIGYVVTAVCDATQLYLVNVWPGWQAVSFLTEETRQVLGLVNLSLAAGLVANLIYLAQDAGGEVPG